MFKKLGLLLSVATILLTPSNSFALDQIIRPYQTVRSAGMGGVRITTGEYEENFNSNPARVAANPVWRITLLDLSLETSTATINHMNDLSKAKSDNLQPIAETVGDNLHARIQTAMPGFYSPNPDGKIAWAFALLTSTQIDIIARRNYSIDPTTIIDVGPTFSLARRYLPENALVVGFNTHLAYRAANRRGYSLADVIQGTSFSPSKNGDNGAMIDFDLGGTYDFNHWTPHGIHFHTALTINNLLDGQYKNLSFHPIKSAGTTPRTQPRSIGVGLSATKEEVSLVFTKLSHLMAALEFTDIGNNKNGSLFRTIHIGAEARWKALRPRIGLYQGYPAAGLGLDFKILSLDLATYGEEMSLNTGGKEDRRVALRLAFHI